MGEKGNVTSAELAGAGGGAVIGAPGTAVTAVFEKASETIRDKVLDKGADAIIAGAAGAAARGRDSEAEPAVEVDDDDSSLDGKS